MQSYLEILEKILTNGTWKQNRTGIKTLSISGHMFEHNMAEGFPATTTKKLAVKPMKVELQGFINGITDKRWYQGLGCNIWNGWGHPKKAPYGNDEASKLRMAQEPDLGPIYGFQWRCFNGTYDGPYDGTKPLPTDGVDQFKKMIETLKKDPLNRRIIVSAWNPLQLDQMALPPCHYSFQVLSDGKNLDLHWSQRSCDVPLGIPFNIASYALLLELIAKETGLVPQKLIGDLADVHIYENQMDGVKEQLSRQPKKLPTLEISNFTSIFDWTYDQAKLLNYECHPKIEFPVAI